MDQRSNNKTQRLQQWFDERPRWDHASYGEFMHIGANQTIFRIALEEQEISTQTKVLDTACAVGGNARWMASLFGCQVWGNDIDAEALSVAKDLAEIENISELCTFVEAPVEALPFEDNTFNIVVTTDVLTLKKSNESLSQAEASSLYHFSKIQRSPLYTSQKSGVWNWKHHSMLLI